MWTGAQQCSREAKYAQEEGGEKQFCHLHFHSRCCLKHGVQGSTLPRDDLHVRLMAALKARKETTFVWYSRDYMWHLAEKRGVAGLNSLDNGTYVDLLNQVSFYYSVNADVRARLALEKFRGPQSIDDRATVRENYLGNLSKFQFYDRRMMDRILGEAPFFFLFRWIAWGSSRSVLSWMPCRQ